jgi:hypothetical protein
MISFFLVITSPEPPCRAFYKTSSVNDLKAFTEKHRLLPLWLDAIVGFAIATDSQS